MVMNLVQLDMLKTEQGIAIYDLSTNNLLNGAQRGDSITITGTLVDYNGHWK